VELERVSSDKIIVRPSHKGGYFEESDNQWDHLWITGRRFTSAPKPSSFFKVVKNGNIVPKSKKVWVENPGASNVYSFVEYGPPDKHVPVDPFPEETS